MEDIGHEVHQLRRLLQRVDNAGKVVTLLDLTHLVEPCLAFHELDKLVKYYLQYTCSWQLESNFFPTVGTMVPSDRCGGS